MLPQYRHYRAFGLHFQSALPLPELREVPAEGRSDVRIEIGSAPAPDAPELATHVRAAPDLFWMEVPKVARFLVTGGDRMVVEPYPGVAEGDIRAFLLGSAVGALLHQRGFLPLHSSAVELGGHAVAFVAPSGGGKSTIAMHLHHLGHRVIADDLCAVEIADGAARIWPGLRNLKLWRASLDAIETPVGGLEPVLASMDKYRVPVDALADDRAFDLRAIVRLEWGEMPILTPLSGAQAAGVLIANTFRGQLVKPMAREAVHWRQCLDVSSACSIFQLSRPRALDLLADVSALVVERLAATARP